MALTPDDHQLLSDLMPILEVPYFRFNPHVPIMSLDETNPPKLRELQADTAAGVQARGALEAEVTGLKARLVENQVHADEERAGLARQAEEATQKAFCDEETYRAELRVRS